jgi:cob(I)alamin adenosyltransferase
MKIYTKTGDNGTTSLYSGERIAKSSKRIDLYGTIDELQSIISIALEFNPEPEMLTELEQINTELFNLSSDFATTYNSKNSDKIERISADNINNLENLIDKWTKDLSQLKEFIQPKGDKCASFINLARTVCRRAERIAIELSENEKMNPDAIIYLNRLSDFLWTAMRKQLTYK